MKDFENVNNYNVMLYSHRQQIRFDVVGKPQFQQTFDDMFIPHRTANNVKFELH